MDAKIFSSIKKYEKSNAIGFKSVPLNIKIGVFLVKKEHTFSGFPHRRYSIIMINEVKFTKSPVMKFFQCED